MEESNKIHNKTTFTPGGKPKIPVGVYLAGIGGIIPLLGALVGLVLTVLGIFYYENWKLIVIGPAGIMWTVLLYGSLFVFIRSKMGRSGLVPIAQQFLIDDALEIEFYKLEHGEYPDSLEQLSPENHMIMYSDPTQSFSGKKNSYFQYQKLGDRYTLNSLGPDGTAHTADDIYPEIPPDTGRIRYGRIKL